MTTDSSESGRADFDTDRVLVIAADEPRGAESSGEFVGGSWRIYALREKGRTAGFMLHVRVAPNVYRKARLPVEREGLDTRSKRASFAADAAPVILANYRAEQATKPGATPAEKSITFLDFAELWTDGTLHDRYPDHVKKKKTSDDDAARFEFMRSIVGDVLLRDFALDHAEKIMRAVPRELSTSTRRHYAQTIHKLLSIAVYPARLIPVHPLPKGFLPKLGPQKAKGYLRPDEDAALLACTKLGTDGAPVVPLWRRVYWGFLSREGTREGEAIELRWGDVDLKHGGVTLDENKSDDPRAWALDPSVTEALRAWAKVHPLCEDGKAAPPKDARVFVTDEGEALDPAHLPRTLRADLIAAGVDRPELHATTKARLRLRVHDLRGTFVTVSLANGATESWISDRTGHKSSAMINRYKRAARTVAELGLGRLKPLAEAIPEFVAAKPPEPTPGGEPGEPDLSRNLSREEQPSAALGGPPHETPVKLAESKGFEPLVAFTTPDFESGTFGHSVSSPPRKFIHSRRHVKRRAVVTLAMWPAEPLGPGRTSAHRRGGRAQGGAGAADAASVVARRDHAVAAQILDVEDHLDGDLRRGIRAEAQVEADEARHDGGDERPEEWVGLARAVLDVEGAVVEGGAREVAVVRRGRSRELHRRAEIGRELHHVVGREDALDSPERRQHEEAIDAAEVRRRRLVVDHGARRVADELVPRIDEQLDGLRLVFEVREREARGDARVAREVERRSRVRVGVARRALAVARAAERERHGQIRLVDLDLAVVVRRRGGLQHAEHDGRDHLRLAVVRARRDRQERERRDGEARRIHERANAHSSLQNPERSLAVEHTIQALAAHSERARRLLLVAALARHGSAHQLFHLGPVART
jgi:hypothetical protein